MATQPVLDSLTLTIQDCLESKMQDGFAASSALTVDIAREIAGAVENKCNEYTDIEIKELKELITNGEVDLGPFTEFMNTIKTLLDGDENTEGYQIFQTLITDTTANSQTIVNHTTSIASINQSLTTMQETLANHETRITALENADDPTDCEECHDELLNLLKGSIQEACTGAAGELGIFYNLTSGSVLANFKVDCSAFDVLSRYSYVFDGANAYPETVSFACPGDFEVNMRFAVAEPQDRKNFMLFGGDYDKNLYVRLNGGDRSIRVWMNSVDNSDHITFTPSESDPYDGNMHDLTLARVGNKMRCWLSDEYLGEQDAYMYTGTNDLFIGNREQGTDAVGLPFIGTIENFKVETIDPSAGRLTACQMSENQVINVSDAYVRRERCLYVDTGPSTVYRSLDSNTNYRRALGTNSGKFNIVIIGASIMEQAHYSYVDAAKRFLNHGLIAEVYNRATSGDTSGDLLGKIPGYLEEFKGQESRTLFVMHIGGNDISQGGGYPGNSTSLESNYNAIIDAIHAAQFQVAPCTVTYRIPPASNPSEPYNTNIVIPAILAKTPTWVENGAPILDLYQQSFDNQDSWFEADGIHHNGLGEALLREYFASTITARLKATMPNSRKWFVKPSKKGIRRAVINCGTSPVLLGGKNNVDGNGTISTGLCNSDYSPIEDAEITFNGFGDSIAPGKSYGIYNRAATNRAMNEESFWVAAGSEASVDFNDGAVNEFDHYEVKLACSRDVLEDRFTVFQIGDQEVEINASHLQREVAVFEDVLGSDLRAHGIKVRAKNGSSYGYLSGFEITQTKEACGRDRDADEFINTAGSSAGG